MRGTGDMAYAIPNLLVDFHNLDIKIPVGPWRAPYANANTFATESFIDELAHAAGKDPVAFRLAMLPPASRARNVLELAAQRANWGSAVPAGRARGVALAAVGRRLDRANRRDLDAPASGLQVHRTWAAVDRGPPVNRRRPRNAGHERDDLRPLGRADGQDHIHQRRRRCKATSTTYTVLHMREAPSFDVSIVSSTAAPTGCGEIGTPRIAPAVANAYFTLTGKRVRTLPLLENLT